MKSCDALVVGAGIAGASAAYELAERAEVILLEREDRPGYHTTGRSAAIFLESYGPQSIRCLTRASRAFYENPPEGFAEHPLLGPRDTLFIARENQLPQVAAYLADVKAFLPEVEEISAEAACAMVPVLRPGYAAAAVREPGAMDIDVAALHQGYLTGFRRRGGELVLNAEVSAIRHVDGRWRVATRNESYEAGVIVNAAGAWGDVLAEIAGVRPVGLVPKRRTAVTFDPPEGTDVSRWPLVADIEEDFYFKPESGRIMASPADETPSPPCDAQPEELDIATVMDHLEKATTFAPRHLTHRWAGLRSFVADKSPVIGFDGGTEGFFWLVGQGGYGIQSAPAVARCAARLLLDGELPPDIFALGVTEATLGPGRLR